MTNIRYQSAEIAAFFAASRISWSQFYESERAMFERIAPASSWRVLDIGCGCGGLGLALEERFSLSHYTGVEINPQAAEAARSVNPQAEVLQGDVLELAESTLAGRRFDLVCSLSCIDWNVEFDRMLDCAWSLVEPGGWMAATFRVTLGEGCFDPAQSYQHINFEGARTGERAAYIVLGARDIRMVVKRLRPTEVVSRGYWGVPSASAVTPYQTLCFAAFAFRKGLAGPASRPPFDLGLPADIVSAIDVASL